MESFGLFDLFKSLLSTSGAENAPANPESDQTALPVQTDAEQSTQAPAPNAFLDFIHNHDERAKRTKNK